jgi:hypothetical protein
MEKYITKDKVADFVMKLWDKGIAVNLEPERNQLVICKKDGGYAWLPVYEKASYDELVESFINPTEED